MLARLLTVCCLGFVAIDRCAAQESRPTSEFLENWSTWSRDAWKTLQDAKALDSSDLSYCKTMSGVVERKIVKVAKALKLEALFEESAQERADLAIASLDAAIKSYVDNGVVRRKDKKNAIAELEKMKSDLANKTAAIAARKQLLQEIGQNLHSMHLKARTAINAKKLPDDKRKAHLALIEPLERHSAAIQKVVDRDTVEYEALNERSTAIFEALLLIESI